MKSTELNFDDFDISKIVSYPNAGGGLIAETGVVFVTHKPTGIKREYPAGHGEAWAASFIMDIENNLYRPQLDNE